MHLTTAIAYVLDTALGFSAISVAVFGALRSRFPATYTPLIVFFGAYTLQTLAVVVGGYFFADPRGYSAYSVRLIYGTTTALGMTVIVAAAIYFHRFFSVRARTLRDVAAVSISLCAIVLYSLPCAKGIDPIRGVMVLGLPALAATALYIGLFSYVLLVGFSGPKRDRPLRETILIWTLLAFGSLGLLETGLEAFRNFLEPAVGIAFFQRRLPGSMLLYPAVSAVLIYYFGGYILADQSPEHSVPEAFVRRYDISRREQEVASLMNRGFSNPEIAERLFVSVATVKTHVHNIYEKTGATSRYELFHLIRLTKV